MGNSIEIRWHGRGGQGAKTASFLLAEALIEQGKFAQGFPDYGPERMGAPVRGYNRIDDDAIRLHCDIEEPDIVVVLDPTLLATENVAKGLVNNGKVLVNTKESPSAIREKIGLKDGKIYVVDATGIALDETKRPIPNLPMIGALLRISKLSDIEEMISIVKKKFEGKLGESEIDASLRALRRGHDEVKE